MYNILTPQTTNIVYKRITCREDGTEAGRVLREFVEKFLSVEKVGTVVAMNKELLLAREEAFADRETSLFGDR